MKRMSVLLIALLMLNLVACGSPKAQEFQSDAGGCNTNTNANTNANANASFGEWWEYDGTTLARGFGDYYSFSDDTFYYAELVADGYNFVKLNVQEQSTTSYLWNPALQFADDSIVDVTAVDYSKNSIWIAVGVSDDEGNMDSSLYQFDWSGKILTSMELDPDVIGNNVDSSVGVNNIMIIDEDDIMFSMGTQCFLIDDSGVQKISSEYWIEDLLVDESGKIYAITADETQAICPISLNSMEVEAAVFQSDTFGGKYCNSGAYGITHIYSDKICIINTLDDSAEENVLVDYSENSITSSSIAAAWVLDDNTILVVSSDMISGSLELSKLIRTSENPTGGKTVLYIGDCTQGELSLFAQNAISEFNKTNSDYVIQVQEYSDATSLDLAIISGEGPDIICLGGLDENKLVAKGLLVDLYTGLQAYGITNADLVEAYRNCYEVDGRLYSIATEFQYVTMAFRDSSLADCNNWSLSELARYSEEVGDDTAVFGGFSRDTFLPFYLSCTLDQFVNWNEKSCNFDSNSFVTLLELCDSLGDAIADGADTSGESYGYTFSQMRFSDFFSALDGYEYLFPTILEGGLLTTNANSTFGINASANNIDAAFEFIALLLDENTQDYVYDGFPVLSSKFEECYTTAITEGAYAPTTVYEGINRATTHVREDENILAIVQEESEAFYSGDKSAEEVVKLIQSRIGIYIAEQS